MAIRILLIAGLEEPVSCDSRSDSAALAFELATALAECAAATDEIAVDLVARRGARTPLPLISVDPDELLSDGATKEEAALAEEAILCQVALAGLLDGYDVVHTLSPAVAVLQIAAAQGAAIVQSIESGASAAIVRRLIAPDRLVQTERPAGVDLTRFRPTEQPRRDFVLWLGGGDEESARTTAESLALPLRTFGDDDPVALLQHAHALLHFEATCIWPLRALACGTAVTGWQGSGIDESLLSSPSRSAERRQLALARFGARAMVGRCREIYRELVHGA